jgi:hypothetical protein
VQDLEHLVDVAGVDLAYSPVRHAVLRVVAAAPVVEHELAGGVAER